MSEISGVIGFGILSIVLLFFAKRAKYFLMPNGEIKWEVPVRWFHVVIVFGIYLATMILIVPFLGFLMKPIFSSSPIIAKLTWLNFLASFFTLGAIVIYCVMIRTIAWKIWQRNDQVSFLQNMGFAFISFIIAFPIVIFFNEALDLLLFHFFNIQELPEQLAVRFLKMTFNYPGYLFLSIVTIVAFAPMLEELLFRGFLQTFLRNLLGTKGAILITSFCFSLFHYSPDQGLANISIIGSLFVLALFLGFVYEKQGSLAVPMALHALFNGCSVLNLYFLGGFPKPF